MKKSDQTDIDSFEEPSPEDFLVVEEETEEEKKGKRRKKILFRLIGISIALMLIGQVLNIWFDLFSPQSRELARISEQLSMDEEVEFYKEAVAVIVGSNSRGTGFFITHDGYMLTNHHVIEQNEPFRISLPNGEQYEAEVIESIEEPDLALLKVDGHDLPYLPLREHGAEIDEEVYVIGNPGLQLSIVNEGTIEQTDGHYQRMRITNTILPGHSGSPVISKDGQVVGVVYARTTGNEAGYGLAVPLEQIYDHFPQLKDKHL